MSKESQESPSNSTEGSPRDGNGSNSARALLTARFKVKFNAPYYSKRRAAHGVMILGGITTAGGAALAIVSAVLSLGLAPTVVGGVIAAIGLLAMLIAGIYKATLEKPDNYAKDNELSKESPTFSRVAN